MSILPALLYLQWHQVRNRTLARVRRLRQPKYLFGALVGGVYIYLNFLRFFLPVPGQAGFPTFSIAEFAPLVETLGAVLLAVVVGLAWVVPRERAALVFGEAEIAFLFPAPVSRRALIHWKLLRSQAAILFTILFLTLVTGRFRFGTHVWTQTVGWWVILSTLNLHLLAASFARTRLLERGLTPWRRRVLVLAGTGALLAGALWWTRETLPIPPDAGAVDPRALLRYGVEVAGSPAIRVLLAPFRVPLGPFLAADARAFALALLPALGLLAWHYLWVVRADVAFEEASLALSRRHAERLGALRAGRGAPVAFRRRRAPFPLRPTGPRVTAILWKNLLAAGSVFNVRLALLLGWLAVVFGLVLGRGLHTSPWPPILGLFALQFVGLLLLFGPMMARQDLRQDLANLDLLKTYPLPGWQIVLGELLAPAAILTVSQWALLALAAGLFTHGADQFSLEVWGRSAAPMLAAAVLAPAWNLLFLLIPNAAVLLLPSWFQPGTAGPRGVEVLGQRLIFLLGQLLVATVALLPAAGLAGAVGLAAGLTLGSEGAGPMLLAAGTGALVLLGETALALGPLGRRLETFDLSVELPPRG